jgi:hypothetical protein
VPQRPLQGDIVALEQPVEKPLERHVDPAMPLLMQPAKSAAAARAAPKPSPLSRFMVFRSQFCGESRAVHVPQSRVGPVSRQCETFGARGLIGIHQRHQGAVRGDNEMKRFLVTAAAVVALAAPAFANHCPKDMAAIDAALAKNPKLSAADMAQVKKLRADGEALHKAGKHKESVETLQKAEDILHIPHIM